MIERVRLIQSRLDAALKPTRLEVIDDSHLHKGHEGAKGGAGHYTVIITSSSFANRSLLQRHRMIYEILADLIPQEIHALKIYAYSE